MGRSLSTELVYGYYLGDEDDEWTCLETIPDSWGRPRWPSWVKLGEDGYPDEEEDEGFIEQCNARLAAKFLELAGFTSPEPDWENERDAWYDWVNRRNAAKAAAGVGSGPWALDLVHGGVSDYPAWFLGVRVGSGSSHFELTEGALLLLKDYKPVYDDRLRKAIEFLEVKPEEEHPKLFVVASYG